MERELWKLLYLMATKLDKPWGHWKYSTADIVVVYLWCVISDRPMCWAVEETMARRLIPDLPGSGYLLGDPIYDSNVLFDLAHAADHQLLTPKRRKNSGLGHHRQSPYRLRCIELMQHRFGKALYRFRRQIE